MDSVRFVLEIDWAVTHASPCVPLIPWGIFRFFLFVKLWPYCFPKLLFYFFKFLHYFISEVYTFRRNVIPFKCELPRAGIGNGSGKTINVPDCNTAP